MDGMLNIYKESGYTSHDVVAKLRGILHTKKIGHTGTLDPAAQGVLPVCIGKATKLCDLLADHSKTYRAVMRLGVSTDTEDMTGTVLEERDVTQTSEQVAEAIHSFVGAYDQIPPMYSARKINGKKLYELAREGKVVERKPVQVEISSIEIIDISLPLVTMEISCSKGTYIRSLCRDIGQKLGCLAAMQELVRTRVGRFALDDALRLSEIEALQKEGKIGDVLHPVDEAFLELPKFVAPVTLEKLLDNGNAFPYPGKEQPDELRVYKQDGTFIGIYCYEKTIRKMKPKKLFFVKG